MDTTCLVPAALTFVTELDRAYPDRLHDSDGSVAGAAHSAASPNSDHEHGTPQPGDRDVDAVDIDADLIPGDPVASQRAMYGDVIPRFQVRHRAQYWIFNDEIAFASEGWVPRSYAYAGPHRNRHTHHCHFNWREDEASHNDTTPYGFKGVDDMEPADVLAYDPGLKPGTTDVVRGGIANPLYPAKQPDNPTITPATALAWVADLCAKDFPAFVKLMTEYTKRPPAPTPVTLSDADRGKLIAEVAAAVRAELPALVAQALQGIEYAPRRNTP